MTQRVAYLWGPISSFAGPLAAALVKRGWQVHVATKSSLNVFSLSPLDLHSTAMSLLEQSLGGREKHRTFQDRLKLVDEAEVPKGTTYDAIIFCGLPPNFDEPRGPRAPWAAARLPAIAKSLRGIPLFIISSLWAGVQTDGVVPEEFEFERRKPLTQWEGVCQSYEHKLLEGIANCESPWYLIRMPMLCGAESTGETLNFTGPYNLIKSMVQLKETPPSQLNAAIKSVKVNYNPESTMWYLPVDYAISTFCQYLEDENRPRICNLVSTQSTLNVEWMNFLANAVGFDEAVVSDSDRLNLPGTLRKMLLDDVQVKTRNFFEVSGRYQLNPVRIDKDYFTRLLAFGKDKRWGQPAAQDKRALTYSQRLAQYYFEEFIPSKFDESLLKKATTGGTSIGFMLKGADRLGWVLKASNGTAIVERLEPTSDRPSICFRFTGSTMTQLIQSRLSLHRALLLKEVEVEGPLLQALKVSNMIEKFLRQNPMDSTEFAARSQDA